MNIQFRDAKTLSLLGFYSASALSYGWIIKTYGYHAMTQSLPVTGLMFAGAAIIGSLAVGLAVTLFDSKHSERPSHPLSMGAQRLICLIAMTLAAPSLLYCSALTYATHAHDPMALHNMIRLEYALFDESTLSNESRKSFDVKAFCGSYYGTCEGYPMKTTFSLSPSGQMSGFYTSSAGGTNYTGVLLNPRFSGENAVTFDWYDMCGSGPVRFVFANGGFTGRWLTLRGPDNKPTGTELTDDWWQSNGFDWFGGLDADSVDKASLDQAEANCKEN